MHTASAEGVGARCGKHRPTATSTPQARRGHACHARLRRVPLPRHGLFEWAGLHSSNLVEVLRNLLRIWKARPTSRHLGHQGRSHFTGRTRPGLESSRQRGAAHEAHELSTCIAHPVPGLHHATSPCSMALPFRPGRAFRQTPLHSRSAVLNEMQHPSQGN